MNETNNVMINSEKIKQETLAAQTSSFNEIKIMLRKYGCQMQDFLVPCIESICEVDNGSIFSKDKTLPISQTRWLYWYTIRITTQNTYEQIATHTAKCGGHKYTKDAVRKGFEKMGALIAKDATWRRRWHLIKNIIREQKEVEIEEKNKITIHIPRELRDKIEFEIKKE